MHQHAAQGIASLGRGPDTELVHMTKGEVAGLQSLALAHGGSLTINPHTGLVEAGFLSSFLPMLVGAGLSIASGGTLTPLMAAGLMGGGTALATGSLKKGLMAGLGAYGGAGLAGGLMGAGAVEAAGSAMAGAPAAAATTGAEVASDFALNLTAPSSTAPTLANAAYSNAASPPSFFNAMGQVGNAPTVSTAGVDNILKEQLQTQLNPLANTQIANAVPKASSMALGPTNAAALRMPSPYEQMVGGLKNVTSSGANALAFAKDNAYPLGAMGLAALGSSEPEKFNPPPTSPGMIRPYTYNSVQNEPENPIGALYTPGQSTRERNYMTNTYTAGTPYAAPGPEYKMAEGGVASLDKYSYNPDTSAYSPMALPSGSAATPVNPVNPVNPVDAANIAAMEANTYTYDPVKQRYSQVAPDPAKAAPVAARPWHAGPELDSYVRDSINAGYFANGGLVPMRFASGGSNLGGYSDGGQLLRGPGDGVSDSIPAMIGQKQHARLADGEFVVPARIVSELGNGSTEAGARQLYAMMDRVQNARRKAAGKDKVATNTKASRLLPA